MPKKVKPKGAPVYKTAAYQIIRKGKAAKSKLDCPYRKGWVRYSIWMTAFKYKTQPNDAIYSALLKAGVPCNGQEVT